MATFIASFKCDKCGALWETEYHAKPKTGFKDYCQCKQCLQVRKKEGGELRPLHDALTYRKA
jgi:hypothetical protein